MEHKEDSSSDAPLQGLLVLDLSRVLTGPYAGMMLGDMGARVIKVERKETGDETRFWGPPFVGSGETETSTYFLSVNRNKESLALDFGDVDDFSSLLELIRRADILVENFRPGVMERLGLTPQRLQELNRRLIILSITGFGHDGPSAARSGYDQIVQGESGLMSMTGQDGDHPTKIGVPIADVMAAVFGVCGVLAALHRRDSTGKGDVVRTSLLAAAVASHTFQGTRWLMAGEVPTAVGNRHPTLVPYQAFQCQDGRWLQLAVGTDEMWHSCAALLGLDPGDGRFVTNRDRVAHREILMATIEGTLKQFPIDHWLRLFADKGIPAGEIKSLDAVYSDAQAIAQGLVLALEHPQLGTIRVPGSPIRFGDARSVGDRPPPLLDEHRDRILGILKESI